MALELKKEAGGPIRRISCIVVRFYVAKYGAPAAEAWARLISELFHNADV